MTLVEANSKFPECMSLKTTGGIKIEMTLLDFCEKYFVILNNEIEKTMENEMISIKRQAKFKINTSFIWLKKSLISQMKTSIWHVCKINYKRMYIAFRKWKWSPKGC